MPDITIKLREEDRQMVLLSLALCSLKNPGFDYSVGLIADQLNGREMFESFKRLNRDAVPRASI